MKKYLNGILVVEGTGDSSYISSLINAEIIETNGYDIPKEELNYLKEAIKTKPIYLLLDPDDAGESIRLKINSEIPGCLNIYAQKEMCNKKNKHGIAECTKEHIFEILDPYLVEKIDLNKEINLSFYYEHIKNYKKFIIDKFNLGLCNTKKLIERLNSLNISKRDILKAVEDHGNK